MEAEAVGGGGDGGVQRATPSVNICDERRFDVKSLKKGTKKILCGVLSFFFFCFLVSHVNNY